MKLLYSNIKPCEYSNSTFSEAFESGILNSDEIKIATGYITEESLLELKSILLFYLDEGKVKTCSLVLGMHGREGFTRTQYEAAIDLASFLKDKNIGSVHVCTAFKFHGKTYLFYKAGEPISGMLGSSNLSNIVDSRQWEVDVFFTENEALRDLESLHSDLVKKASHNILDWKPAAFNASRDLLKNRIGVEKADPETYREVENALTDTVFDLPLKTTEKSNLNAYFGKGRLATKTGAIRPRHWYEAELIVPREITSSPTYPKNGSVIRVFTDDGWSFKCKIEGQNGKNFRSENDLRTLGRWIKGRLENAGCLKVGQPVTKEVLDKYGRHTISLKQTIKPDLWLLDFSNKR
ncbi:NgoFVII family restriction endonuclease [Candidatus Giovannonibacteria bacterium]|nr:NgoFVII family restriction endonuclease [Candidatus Giovannonibacteria bacterium]